MASSVNAVRSMPSSSTRPASGLSSPASKLSNVDLPTPDSPMTARYSPCRSSRSRPSKSAGRSGEKRLLKFSSRRTASGIRPRRGAGGSSSVDPDDRLQLQEVAQTELAPLAAVARHFEAAERSVHVARSTIQSHLAGADPCPNAPCMQIVLGPHIGRESIGRIVRDLYRLLLVLVGEYAEHRSEDLFARDGHIVAHIGKNRRLDVVALSQSVGPAGAADDHLGSLGNTLGDV